MATGAARIVYVGHATVRVEMDGVRLLTDPLLRPRLAHLRRVSKVDIGVSRGLDAVLISHLHLDHLDIRSLRRISGSPEIVVPRGAGELLRKRGFTLGSRARGRRRAPRRRAHDSSNSCRARLEEKAIRVTRGAKRIRIEGSRSLYFAGDPDLFDGMSALGPVDVALVPIWGWGPTIGPGHMNPRDAPEAARLLRASIAIPIHWGTYFPLHTALRRARSFLEAPAEEFRSHMRDSAPEIDVRILRAGEQTTA